MGFLDFIFGDPNEEAERQYEEQRRLEEEREKRIKEGTRAIREMFYGGDAEQWVRLPDGTEMPASEFYRQGRGGPRGRRPGGRFDYVGPLDGNLPTFGSQDVEIFSKEQPGIFGDDFFKGLERSYMDYAKPQMEEQYKDNLRRLQFALARTSNLNSSVKGDKFADAQREYDVRRQEITSNARGLSNRKRQEVSDAENALLSQLVATGDPQAAIEGAQLRAESLSKPVEYSPVGQLFTDFSGTLATQADLERKRRSRFDTGLFRPPNSGNSATTVG